MKIRSTEIKMSATKRHQYPAEGLPEIALVGRSNVGKSSCVNALLNRRNFARTSQTPGKTRTINFYLINNEFYFVDLPGYGYAKVAKSEKDKWGNIMETYLGDREELCAIFLLVDIRHEPTNDDVMMYEWIKHFGYECVVIATKADKISRGQYQKHMSIIRKKLQLEKDEKIKVYRRITEVKSIIELENIKDELIDRFGKMPVEAQGFFRYIGLKFRAKKLGIKNALEIKGKVESIIKFNSDKVNFDVLLKLIQEGLIKYQKKDDTIEYNGTIEEFLNVYEQ